MAGEPEMPTKTYVYLKHGVQFEPLEKVVFDERLFLTNSKIFVAISKEIENRGDFDLFGNFP